MTEGGQWPGAQGALEFRVGYGHGKVVGKAERKAGIGQGGNRLDK